MVYVIMFIYDNFIGHYYRGGYIDEFEPFVKIGIPRYKLFVINFGYDLVAKCTSAAYKDQHGYIYHIRTMDWAGELLKELTFNATFIENGKPVFKATMWMGHVGIFTGMKADSEIDNNFTISLNFRKPALKSDWLSIAESIFNMMTPYYYPTTFSIRDFLTYTNSKNVGLAIFEREFYSPCYLVVTTIDTARRYVIGPGTIDSKSSEEFPIVQTNHDTDINVDLLNKKWSAGDPLLENSLDRHAVCFDLLNDLSKKLVIDTYSFENYQKALFGILETEPIFSPELTIYSNVMSVEYNSFATRVY